MSRKDIELFLNNQTEKVKKNVKIISKEDLGQDFMLHISGKKMDKEKYIPFIGLNQLISEDRTVPRVTCSPYLLGCIYGYARIIMETLNLQPGKDILYDSSNKNIYKGGWYIHGIPFEYALKPNYKLVYDQPISEEHWLVRYNENTTQYGCYLIGKMFVRSVLIEPFSDRVPENSITFYININKPVQFNEKIKLNNQYWSFTFPYYKFKINSTKKIVYKEITAEEFNSEKKLRAALLSHEPIYSEWK